VFMSTGWGKVHDLAKVTSFFQELGPGLKSFNAALARLVEATRGS